MSDIRARLAEIDENMLLADRYDEAIIGYGQRCGQPPIVIYDREKCIEILMRDGLSYDDADDFFCFNTEGAWFGDRTPLFMSRV